MRQLYSAMTNGNIEAILKGSKKLDNEPWEDYPLETIPKAQQDKTIEILNYLKRQNNLKN
jgi:hypothetical protein